MLLGDDVIDLKRIERIVFGELAVFADTAYPIPNELTQIFIHERVTGNQVRFETSASTAPSNVHSGETLQGPLLPLQTTGLAGPFPPARSFAARRSHEVSIEG